MSDATSKIARTHLKQVLTRLCMDYAYYGFFALRLKRVEARFVKTMATDGLRLYFNPDYVVTLEPLELLYVLCHECHHVLEDHLSRLEDRDLHYLNMAADYNTNWGLTRLGIGKRPTNALYDDRYTDDLSIIEIHDLLVEAGEPPKPCLDMHLEIGGDELDPQTGEPLLQPDDGEDEDGATPDIRPARQRILENAMEAVQLADRAGQGESVPESVRRTIRELSTPKVSWRTLLRPFLRSMSKRRQTYMRMPRRQHPEFLMPGKMREQAVTVDVFIDASISVTPDMLTDFMAEVVGIGETFRDITMRVCGFDTEIHNPQTFTTRTLPRLRDYEVHGEGGTSFEVIYDYLKGKKIRPERLVILTDGMPNNGKWGDAEYCPTIFVIHSNPSLTSPYGITAHYQPE